MALKKSRIPVLISHHKSDLSVRVCKPEQCVQNSGNTIVKVPSKSQGRLNKLPSGSSKLRKPEFKKGTKKDIKLLSNNLQNKSACDSKKQNTKMNAVKCGMSKKFPVEHIKHQPLEVLPDKLKKTHKPASIVEKKNKLLSKKHILDQKDIKFEADEFFRSVILSGRELSPSIMKSRPGSKLQSVLAERPSVCNLKIPEVSSDPYKDAMEALQSACEKRQRMTELMPSSKPFATPFKVERFSAYNRTLEISHDPYKAAMKAIENFSAKRNQNSSLKQESGLRFSAYSDFPSLCKSEKQKGVLKNSEVSISKHLKSSKKVTFCLETQGSSVPKISEDKESLANKDPNGPLINIGEKAKDKKEDSPNALQVKKDLQQIPLHGGRTQNEKEDSLHMNKKENSPNSLQVEKSPQQIPLHSGETQNEKENEFSKDLPNDKIKSNATKHCVNSTFNGIINDKLNTHASLLHLLHENNNEKLYTSKDISLNCIPKETQKVERLENSHGILITPCPISINSQSSTLLHCSPEFLTGGSVRLPLSAIPIQTPLVLKSISRNSGNIYCDLSPIRTRLDFLKCNENFDKEFSEEKVTPRRVSVFSSPLPGLPTMSNILDNLADEECGFLNQRSPVLCGRYLLNPVAAVLDEGDEMHFVPIYSRKH